MVNFIVRLFAGKLSSLVSAFILFAVLHGFAWLAANVPAVAALCDPQAVADWFSALSIALLNVAANRYHLDRAAASEIETALERNRPIVPVRRAEPARHGGALP